MSDADFPDFAVKLTREVREEVAGLPAELRVVWDQIEMQLAENPMASRDQLSRVGRSGEVQIYKHPRPKVEVTLEIDREAKVVYVWNLATPRMERRKLVFISYSHEDKGWLEKMRKFLGDLEEQDVVEFWADTEIIGGQEWQERIDQTLGSAKAALLLVSQNFLNSEFISGKELPKLLEAAQKRDLRILWVPVSTCRVQKTKIYDFQALHDPEEPLDLLDDGRQNQALLRICDKLEEALAS